MKKTKVLFLKMKGWKRPVKPIPETQTGLRQSGRKGGVSLVRKKMGVMITWPKKDRPRPKRL